MVSSGQVVADAGCLARRPRGTGAEQVQLYVDNECLGRNQSWSDLRRYARLGGLRSRVSESSLLNRAPGYPPGPSDSEGAALAESCCRQSRAGVASPGRELWSH